MATEPKHTPEVEARNSRVTRKPWARIANAIHATVETQDGSTLYPTVALLDTRTTAWERNADFIVRAVNSYEALRDALAECLGVLIEVNRKGVFPREPTLYALRQRASTALALCDEDAALALCDEDE